MKVGDKVKAYAEAGMSRMVEGVVAELNTKFVFAEGRYWEVKAPGFMILEVGPGRVVCHMQCAG